MAATQIGRGSQGGHQNHRRWPAILEVATFGFVVQFKGYFSMGSSKMATSNIAGHLRVNRWPSSSQSRPRSREPQEDQHNDQRGHYPESKGDSKAQPQTVVVHGRTTRRERPSLYHLNRAGSITAVWPLRPGRAHRGLHSC
jgi:hypothetical protein